MWECSTQGLIASAVIRATLPSLSFSLRLSSETSELLLPNPSKNDTSSAKADPNETVSIHLWWQNQSSGLTLPNNLYIYLSLGHLLTNFTWRGRRWWTVNRMTIGGSMKRRRKVWKWTVFFFTCEDLSLCLFKKNSPSVSIPSVT